MATVMRCDRCRLVDAPCVTVLGKDLCLGCQTAFQEWVAMGYASSAEEKLDRQAFGKRWRQVMSLINVHGHVTSAMLNEHFGMTRTSATWYLHATSRQGKLTFHGKGVFTLPKAEAAE